METKYCFVAKQGGFQPAVVTGLLPVLNEGDVFRSTKNHIDYPDRLLSIPAGCVGVVEKYEHSQTDGTVSILDKDTITARRLIARANQNLLNSKNRISGKDRN